MPVESSWTDEEWATYLRGSSDLDDVSLAWRLDLVARLRQRVRLNPTETELFEMLLKVNALELAYLRAPTAYKLRHSRPCLPRHHWSRELEELFVRTI